MTTDENMRSHAGALLVAVWAQHIVWFFFVKPLRPLAYRRRRRRRGLEP